MYSQNETVLEYVSCPQVYHRAIVGIDTQHIDSPLQDEPKLKEGGCCARSRGQCPKMSQVPASAATTIAEQIEADLDFLDITTPTKSIGDADLRQRDSMPTSTAWAALRETDLLLLTDDEDLDLQPTDADCPPAIPLFVRQGSKRRRTARRTNDDVQEIKDSADTGEAMAVPLQTFEDLARQTTSTDIATAVRRMTQLIRNLKQAYRDGNYELADMQRNRVMRTTIQYMQAAIKDTAELRRQLEVTQLQKAMTDQRAIAIAALATEKLNNLYQQPPPPPQTPLAITEHSETKSRKTRRLKLKEHATALRNAELQQNTITCKDNTTDPNISGSSKTPTLGCNYAKVFNVPCVMERVN